MHTLALSLLEGVQLLKLCIHPLLVYLARIVFPSTGVVHQLKTIYQLTLELKSWGVTTDIFSHNPDTGGYGLAPPKTFLYWQHATAFMNCANNPLHVLETLSHSFRPFAKELGLGVNYATLPTFQMGSNVCLE